MKKQIGFLVAVFLVVGFIVTGCGASSGAVIETPQATQDPTPAATPPQEVAGVGYFIEWTDVKVSLLEANVYTDYNEYFGPDEGFKFVSVLVEFEALADDVSYNPLYWKLVDSQSYGYDYYFMGKEPMLDSSNALKSGRKAKGWLTFQVPKTETSFYLVLSDYTHDGEWQFTVGK
jgi:hypothetical protein